MERFRLFESVGCFTMVYDKVDRLIAKRSFEYGPTTVEVYVRVQSYKKSNTPTYGDSGSSYVRKVFVKAVGGAYEGSDNNVHNSSRCALVVSPHPPSSVQLSKWEQVYGIMWPNTDLDSELEKKRAAYDGPMIPKGPAVDITTQIEETVEPVLEELDVHHRLTGVSMDVDIDVTMEYLSAEVSLQEVEDELGWFERELAMDES